jgi:hypothetical protein
VLELLVVGFELLCFGGVLKGGTCVLFELISQVLIDFFFVLPTGPEDLRGVLQFDKFIYEFAILDFEALSGSGLVGFFL